MFLRKFIELRAAAHELSRKQRKKNLAMMLETILPSLLQTVMIQTRITWIRACQLKVVERRLLIVVYPADISRVTAS